MDSGSQNPIDRLAAGLNRLPGVGPKSARRIALDMLTWRLEDVRALSDLMVQVRSSVRECSTCFNLDTEDPCAVCRDPKRDRGLVMVVDTVAQVMAVERTSQYRGLYHVLGGRLSPLDGVMPEDLKIQELEDRLTGGDVREVILANEPTVEGDATAQYIHRLLGPTGLPVTQIARGLPVGSDLALADQVTLARALEGRREM